MKRALVACALLFGATALAKVKVVASVADLAALARAVGGDQVEVQVLAKATQDPHFVDPRPSLVVTLSRADLLVLTGMDLEVGWLPSLLTGSRNGKLQKGEPGYLDASTLVTPKELPTQKLDRSMGDIHPGGNPHYLKDPGNGVLVARGLAARLAELDPPHAELFRANAKAFEDRLNARIAEWMKALAPFRGTPVVPYHKSWIYFTEWAGLTEVAFVEPKPGLPPSSGQVAKVLGVIVARKVPLLLQEEWYSSNTTELLASKGNAALVRVPGMPGEGQAFEDYFGGVVAEVVKALGSRKAQN